MVRLVSPEFWLTPALFSVETGDWSYEQGNEWWETLLASVAKNVAFTEDAEKSDAVPMGYFRVFKEIRDQVSMRSTILSMKSIVLGSILG